MKITNPAQIRNFVVAGHNGCGKTTLCDLMLFKAGAVDRLGSVDAKTSVSDFTPDEQDKRSSIYASFMHCDWKDHKLFLTDTPGYGEFVGEVISSFRSCGFAVIVLDGVDGIQIGSTRAWAFSRDFLLPRMFFVNRLDRERASFDTILEHLQEAYGKTVCVPMTLPVGKEGSFSKVISVLDTPDSEIPADLKDTVEEYRTMLKDAAAESDEALMERYLEGEELTGEEIAKGLHKAIFSGSLVPVFAGSTAKDIGVAELMDGIVSLMPNPLERVRKAEDGTEIVPSEDGSAAAYVFKSALDPFIGQMAYLRVLTGKIACNTDMLNLSKGTKERVGQLVLLQGKNQIPVEEVCPGCIVGVAKLKGTTTGDTLGATKDNHAMPRQVYPKPVISFALYATKSGDEDKIIQGLQRLSECDPTLYIERNDETHESLLKGMGEQHINIAIKNLKATAKVDVRLELPKIAYRETIQGRGEAAYRHKKQSGGHGQFAEVHLRMEPFEGGYEFVNAIVGGAIPKNFIPAVEKGIHEAMERGPLAGCVVENMRVTVFDGKYHEVDSSEMAFKIATRRAFKDAMAKSRPALLEPIMNIKVMIPDAFTGDVNGALNHKRGRILGMSMKDGLQVLEAEVPEAEIQKFATELRSMTQGQGSYEVDFARYETVPPNVMNDIISKFHDDSEEDE